MEELSTKKKGEMGELKVLAKLAELGLDVYTPFGESTPSDIIVDSRDSLKRVQVKMAHSINSKDGAIKFNCKSTRSNFTETTEHSYKGLIDGFAVYYPKDESFYYVPIEDAAKTKMTLRLDPPANNQTTGVNMAEDYILEDQF